MTIDQLAYRFLLTGDHELIIHAALKYHHLSPQHTDYQDYFQECRLLFPVIYADFPEDPVMKPHQFLAYAARRLKWRLGDRLKHDRRIQAYHHLGDPTPVLAVQAGPNVTALCEARSECARLIRAVQAGGHPGEWAFIVGTLFNGWSVSELADHHHVSRKTAYRWRQRVLTRGRELFGTQG